MTEFTAPGGVKPFILCILDGWGVRAEHDNNAVTPETAPHFFEWYGKYATAEMRTDGPSVGLPEGQMGNSEVGHMNIGAGRVALPEFGRIDSTLGDGSMAENPVLLTLIEKVKQSGGACHLLGLLSPGGVHSHQDQMAGLTEILVKNGVTVLIHAFSDGRDTPPQSAIEQFRAFEDRLKPLGDKAKIVTVTGRFYAMDRDKRAERVEAAYDAIVSGIAEHKADTAIAAIEAAYERGESDEFILPTLIGDYEGAKDGDGLLAANFRADRARQLLTALLDSSDETYARKKIIRFSATAGAVKYSDALEPFIPALVKPVPYPDGLGETIAKLGLRQLRIAETEKYPHVTFFFNGGQEALFEGEDRILVPSPKVRTYDLKPEMSAYEVVEKLEEVIAAGTYDYIIVNFANADMVGHTGDLTAAKSAIGAVDACLKRLETALEKAGGAALVTADHGNAELMRDPVTGAPHTQHTTLPVPLILVDPCGLYPDIKLENGTPADLAPTVLKLTGRAAPQAMTGKTLLKF